MNMNFKSFFETSKELYNKEYIAYDRSITFGEFETGVFNYARDLKLYPQLLNTHGMVGIGLLIMAGGLYPCGMYDHLDAYMYWLRVLKPEVPFNGVLRVMITDGMCGLDGTPKAYERNIRYIMKIKELCHELDIKFTTHVNKPTDDWDRVILDFYDTPEKYKNFLEKNE